MQSWLDGSNWVGKCAQSTGMTASLRILSSKADSNTWESFTRSKLKLESLSRPWRPFMNSKSALSWPRRPFMNSLPVLSRPRRPFMNSLPVLSRQQGRSWTLCLSCHGRKAVLELSACPVTAKEAIHEPSACPVTAMETVHELTVCTVASMETAQELSACSVTVKWSVLFSAQTWIPALPAPPWIHAPLDLTWWSPGLRSAIAPGPPLIHSLPLLHCPGPPLFHCLPLLHGPGPPVLHDPGPPLLHGLDLPLPQGPGPPLSHDPCHDSWSCPVSHTPCHDLGHFPLHGPGPLSLPLFHLSSTTLLDFLGFVWVGCYIRASGAALRGGRGGGMICNVGFGFCFLFRFSSLLFWYFALFHVPFMRSLPLMWSCHVLLLSVCHVVIGCLVACFPLVGLCHVTHIVWHKKPSCCLLFRILIGVTCCWWVCVSFHAKSSQVCPSQVFVCILYFTLDIIKLHLGSSQLASSGIIVTYSVKVNVFSVNCIYFVINCI